MGLFGKSAEDEKEKELGRLVKEEAEDSKKELLENIHSRAEYYKPRCDKDGIIQFKNEYIAILQRKAGFQVEFVVAFDDLTKEGYRLMAIEEGKPGGFNFYYFQKMEYVR